MFDIDLSYLKINQNRIALLQEMGIMTIEDLIRFYPVRYDVILSVPPVLVDEKTIFEGVIIEEPKIFFIRRNMSRMTFKVQYQDTVYSIAIFNRHFLRSHLSLGTVVTIIGKLQSPSQVVASDIKLQSLESLKGFHPIYNLKSGITVKSMSGYIKKGLTFVEKDLIDFIPENLIQRYQLPYLKEALWQIHFPQDEIHLKQALKYLKYEEFLKFQMTLLFIKRNTHTIDVGINKTFDTPALHQYIYDLPFELTEDQISVSKEILQDIQSPHIMDRLIQGDVGSGKTVVASIAIYANHLAGYQSALMAPTEILASQHYRTLQKLFANTSMRIALLTGSLPAKEKKAIYRQIENYEVDVVVGTHALIQDALQFKKLGLVIADEQHRFGVNQRKKLQDKGDKVDLLTMSATPIPRTVAMVLYGDKDVSAIHTMPSRRKTVKTKVVKTKSMKPILPQLESYIKDGGQCYVVCPLVEDSETMDLQSATKIYEAMCAYYKDKIRIGLLHGRMSDEQKDQIMQAFMKHELDILVSTTVIEVGVDVENANMMVIYDAHRFGLSQLHQLRGRVGRSTQQSYCFLFTSSNDQEALERLTFLENETDGFKIAEYDLKLRGPGELLGQKQSGLPSFLVADIMKDFNILERARIDAGEIIDHIDEPQYYSIRKYLEKKIEKNETYLD